MTAPRIQFSLRYFIALTTVVALATIGFVHNTLLAFAAIAAAGSFLGGKLFQRWQDAELVGAASGGAVGGILWLFLQTVIAYTLLPYFEDSSVGFIGSLWVFSPYAFAVGGAFGCVCWLAIWKWLWRYGRPKAES